MKRFLAVLRKIFVPKQWRRSKKVKKDEDNFDDVNIEIVRKTYADQKDFINKLMDECLAMADKITKDIHMKQGSPFELQFAKFWFQTRVENCKTVWWPAAYPQRSWQKFVDAETLAPLMMKYIDNASAASIREWYGLAIYVTNQNLEFSKLRPPR